MHELDPDFLQYARPNDWGSIQNWRKEQRTRLTALRQSLSGNERHRSNEAVCEVLGSESKFLDGSIGFYWPLDGEIDLRPLMHRLADQGYDLALPVMLTKDRPMEFWAWNTKTRMQNQPIWNVPAPIERNPVVPTVLFVPLLGFDAQCHRLGHGGGYYDRTLAALEPKPFTVGIGYEFGRLPTIYPQAHDVPMDVVVTDRGDILVREGLRVDDPPKSSSN
jgi:5-formyltetrahydrofolate cyclo-ligase